MKVFQILLLTAMVAIAMEKCMAEYLLVEIEDGPKQVPKVPEPVEEPMPKPGPKPKIEPEPVPMPEGGVSPSAKCCAERGVPQKCSYACDLISDSASRSVGLCTSYTTIINNCIEATQLQDCCEKYKVNEKFDCWDVLCGDKSVTCAKEPWVFFERFHKKECDPLAKNIKSCCKL